MRWITFQLNLLYHSIRVRCLRHRLIVPVPWKKKIQKWFVQNGSIFHHPLAPTDLFPPIFRSRWWGVTRKPANVDFLFDNVLYIRRIIRIFENNNAGYKILNRLEKMYENLPLDILRFVHSTRKPFNCDASWKWLNRGRMSISLFNTFTGRNRLKCLCTNFNLFSLC